MQLSADPRRESRAKITRIELRLPLLRFRVSLRQTIPQGLPRWQRSRASGSPALRGMQAIGGSLLARTHRRCGSRGRIVPRPGRLRRPHSGKGVGEGEFEGHCRTGRSFGRTMPIMPAFRIPGGSQAKSSVGGRNNRKQHRSMGLAPGSIQPNRLIPRPSAVTPQRPRPSYADDGACACASIAPRRRRT